MEIPVGLIIWSIPSLFYLFVRRIRKEKWGTIFKNLGWVSCKPKYWLWALGVIVILSLLSLPTVKLIPPEIAESPNVVHSQFVGMAPSFSVFLLILLNQAIFIALGEEIFFRGLLGGWLMRKLGFKIGNSIQAVCFLLIHLPLLMVSTALWPILIVQFIAGFVFGWLRHVSGSILPAWSVHSLINALSIFFLAVL
uniref:CAAX prenyl protease 2/Lysostaphin resistance protein A-like domain-containing protein n=1 Tax=Candidatus Methanophagaceae archaeon ANME-1 ERB6 TaxID=2759912 RepID=A0A7G9YTT6_9EURY|nr:hypothetical protein PFCPEAIJ_00022 [Methanosarcinales archaeon ANME-1 ERB6]